MPTFPCKTVTVKIVSASGEDVASFTIENRDGSPITSEMAAGTIQKIGQTALKEGAHTFVSRYRGTVLGHVLVGPEVLKSCVISIAPAD